MRLISVMWWDLWIIWSWRRRWLGIIDIRSLQGSIIWSVFSVRLWLLGKRVRIAMEVEFLHFSRAIWSPIWQHLVLLPSNPTHPSAVGTFTSWVFQLWGTRCQARGSRVSTLRTTPRLTTPSTKTASSYRSTSTSSTSALSTAPTPASLSTSTPPWRASFHARRQSRRISAIPVCPATPTAGSAMSSIRPIARSAVAILGMAVAACAWLGIMWMRVEGWIAWGAQTIYPTVLLVWGRLSARLASPRIISWTPNVNAWAAFLRLTMSLEFVSSTLAVSLPNQSSTVITAAVATPPPNSSTHQQAT